MFDLLRTCTRRMIALRLPLLLVLMTGVLALAGCGDDPAPTPTPTAAVAAATEPAVLAATDTAAPNVTAPNVTAPSTDMPAVAAGAGVSATAPLTQVVGVSSDTGVVALAAVTPTQPAPEVEEGCEIEPNPDLIGYDGVVAKLGCPIAEATNDPVGINEFGEGPDYKRFMLWFGGEGQIYVLSDDARWLAYTDSWMESDPEILCNPDNLDPATSPPLPRRGFGKLWCTVDTVRTSMGYIGREERLCQHSVVQRFERGRLLACFEDATIRYFRILEDGAWDMEMVQ